MKEAFVKTFLHTLELAVAIGAAWVLTQLFNLDNESLMLVIGIALNALTKFARASEFPVGDYVNER